jgi:hypothetical protein
MVDKLKNIVIRSNFNAYACEICGAMVWFKEYHEKYHKKRGEA